MNTGNAPDNSPLASLGGLKNAPGTRSHPSRGTLENWSSSGLGRHGGREFALELQQTPSLAQWVRALPAWCARHNTSAKVSIECKPEWNGHAGVEIGFGKPELPVKAAQDLLEQLKQEAALDSLVHTIDYLKGVGADVAIIEPLVKEAESLARRLRA